MFKALLSVETLGLKPDITGKVRDIFDLGDELLIVATDRISAYDVILSDPIPGKGVVLTQMTLGWYDLFAGKVKTHFLSSKPEDYPQAFRSREELTGRSMLVKKAERFDVECVMRGYLAGSGWREYCDQGKVCGIDLPRDLRESTKLPEPIFTPATKAQSGHDENISFEKMKEFIPEEDANMLKELSLYLYSSAHDFAEKKGIIVADTKFEFGKLGEDIILIDELLSPDSSRFWPADLYQPGRSQKSYDKQYVRDFLDESGWDHSPPAPRLPRGVIDKTRERYEEACRRLFPNIKIERFA